MSEGLIFHHVGFAVADIDSYLKGHIQPIYGPRDISDVVEDPIQRVRICLVTLQDGQLLELIEPIGDDSPVASIVNEERAGLYHVGYGTTDMDTAIARFVSEGCILVSGPNPAVAFDGRTVAFLYTPYHDLVELVEVNDPDTNA